MLWQRELKLAPVDTPERRAAFEARLHEQIGRINNPAVKTHYEQEVRQRLWTLWRERGSNKSAGGGAKPTIPNGSYKAWRKDRSRPSELVERFAHQMASSRETWKKGAMVAGAKEQISSRDALILEEVLNHPWLLEDYSEEFSELTFIHPELSALRDAILQLQISFCGENGVDREGLRVHLKGSGFGDVLERVGAAHIGIEGRANNSEAPREIVEENWLRTLRAIQLKKQLDGAERAFEDDISEERSAEVINRNTGYHDADSMSKNSSANTGEDNLDDFMAAALEARGLK